VYDHVGLDLHYRVPDRLDTGDIQGLGIAAGEFLCVTVLFEIPGAQDNPVTSLSQSPAEISAQETASAGDQHSIGQMALQLLSKIWFFIFQDRVTMAHPAAPLHAALVNPGLEVS
jgi:hypothetical protein